MSQEVGRHAEVPQLEDAPLRGRQKAKGAGPYCEMGKTT